MHVCMCMHEYVCMHHVCICMVCVRLYMRVQFYSIVHMYIYMHIMYIHVQYMYKHTLYAAYIYMYISIRTCIPPLRTEGGLTVEHWHLLCVEFH